ncbi:MAG: hypothetical protein ABRQ25_13945 [Clostridiaceae bacterium]
MELARQKDGIISGKCSCGICNNEYSWYVPLYTDDIKKEYISSVEGEIICDADDGGYKGDGYVWRRIYVYTKCPKCNVKNRTVEKIKLMR